jgi:hypothetical protein
LKRILDSLFLHQPADRHQLDRFPGSELPTPVAEAIQIDPGVVHHNAARRTSELLDPPGECLAHRKEEFTGLKDFPVDPSTALRHIPGDIGTAESDNQLTRQHPEPAEPERLSRILCKRAVADVVVARGQEGHRAPELVKTEGSSPEDERIQRTGQSPPAGSLLLA